MEGNSRKTETGEKATIGESKVKLTEMEAVREMGREMMEAVNRQKEVVDRQMEIQREEINRQIDIQREERERNENSYRQLAKEQQRTNREDTNTLKGQLERMRIEKEQASRRQTQRLPTYDGANIEFDEWQDKVEAIMVCNAMDYTGLLEALPTSLSGQAKRSFDSLNNQDRQTKDTFFQAMRKKLDPQAEKKNKELFIVAKRGERESIVGFIDRCRMYIRRSGGDTMEHFVIEMLKYKVLDCLPTMDRKILNATIDSDESLDELIIKADALLETETRLIGAVSDSQTGNRAGDIGYTETIRPIERYGDATEKVWATEETRHTGMNGDKTKEVWGTEEAGHIGMHDDTREEVWVTEETRRIGMYEERGHDVCGAEERRPIGMYGNTTEDTWSAEEAGHIGMYGDTWGQNIRDNDDSGRGLQGLMNDQRKKPPFQGYCWLCGQLGHRQKECQMQNQGEWYQEDRQKDQGINPALQELNDQSWQPIMMHGLGGNQVGTDAGEVMTLNMANGGMQGETHGEMSN